LLKKWGYLSVSRLKLGQVLTVGSVFEVMEMGLMVDAIISPIGWNYFLLF
jgi:hypothetical protein